MARHRSAAEATTEARDLVPRSSRTSTSSERREYALEVIAFVHGVPGTAAEHRLRPELDEESSALSLRGLGCPCPAGLGATTVLGASHASVR